MEVVAHYSPGLTCGRCGFDKYPALTIDHAAGGGARQRDALSASANRYTSFQFYLWLRRSGYPSGYDVLCQNCQRIKVVERREWGFHAKDPDDLTDHYRRYRDYYARFNSEFFRKVRDEAIHHYSPEGRCTGCGFDDFRALQIHHELGGGRKHVRAEGTNNLAWILRRDGYPSGFTVLCANCNWLKRMGNN
jgi:hypothetical protein